MMNGSKVPHSLRVVILFLRVAVGISLFYVGFATLFHPGLVRELRAHSITDLYTWLGNPANGSIGFFVAWGLIVVGACLVIGLAARLASLAGIGITVAAYLAATTGASGFTVLANNDLLLIISLAIIFVSDAGSYLGLDMFIHIHFSSKHNK